MTGGADLKEYRNIMLLIRMRGKLLTSGTLPPGRISQRDIEGELAANTILKQILYIVVLLYEIK